MSTIDFHYYYTYMIIFLFGAQDLFVLVMIPIIYVGTVLEAFRLRIVFYH